LRAAPRSVAWSLISPPRDPCFTIKSIRGAPKGGLWAVSEKRGNSTLCGGMVGRKGDTPDPPPGDNAPRILTGSRTRMPPIGRRQVAPGKVKRRQVMKRKGISVPGPSLLNQVSICGSSPANEVLKRHSEILRREYLSLVASSYRAAAVLDMEGTVIRCNELFGRVLGLEEGGAKGKNFFDFLEGEERARLNNSFRELCQRAGYSLLASFRLLSGADLAFNAAALLRNMADHPEVGGIVLEILDISGCARAKRTLDEINRLFCKLGPDSGKNFGTIACAVRELFEADSCCYFRWERDRLQAYPSPGTPLGENLAGPGERFLALRLLRRRAEEPLHLTDLSAREELLEDPVARALGARTFYGQPVMHAGKTSGALCLYHKTPRLYTRDEKDSLNLLARFISLEEAHLQHEMSLRDLIDVVSHELRHPISIIIGYAHTLKSHRDRLDQHILEEILERIENGAKRLEHTVSEILEVSKMEKGMLVMRKEETDLLSVLERAVEEMRAKGVKNPLYVKADQGLPPVSADPEKILKVLIILLDNAAKYSPESSPVEIHAQVHADEVVVSVMDRGPGIPVEDRLLVFEKFYQVEEAMHHSLPGIGLGLYLAREIVQAHGGRIWCTDRKGGGSVFRFTLPI